MALAAALELAGEDIEVREVTRSDPLVKANTAPSLRPTSNPSPNMGMAALPSNAVPGFPFGDS